jgi:hypothetical protein
MTRGRNPIRERIARHLGVEYETVDVAAVGCQGRVWPPLAILLPHLLRHRIVAIHGDQAALVAVRAVTLLPVRTLWSGPKSTVRVGERGVWHTRVEVAGHRLLMQSPDRNQLDEGLRGRPDTAQ